MWYFYTLDKTRQNIMKLKYWQISVIELIYCNIYLILDPIFIVYIFFKGFLSII